MKITDEMLYRHAAEARDIWLDTLPDDSEIPEHEFSDEFNKEMDRLVAVSQKKAKPAKGFRRVAAMFAAVLIGASSWLAVDAEARATFVRWIRTIAPDYVIYHFTGEAPEEDIPNFYCSWLPEGMEARNYITVANRVICFTKQMMIGFTACLIITCTMAQPMRCPHQVTRCSMRL